MLKTFNLKRALPNSEIKILLSVTKHLEGEGSGYAYDSSVEEESKWSSSSSEKSKNIEVDKKNEESSINQNHLDSIFKSSN